jgi:putative hydrolase of the HAD superfamily
MIPWREIRAVTFDVGGTLIETWPSVGHVYAEVAGRFGITSVRPEDLNRQFALAWQARAGFDYSRGAWREVVNQTFAHFSSGPLARECFDAIYARFARASAWRLFDDVFPALEELKSRGLKLGVISNWDERLRPLLADLNLLKWFDAVVVSHEAGWTKPAPEIFQRAASVLGEPPAAILHVGDSEFEDASGARAAGLHSMLVERGVIEIVARPGLSAFLPDQGHQAERRETEP